jgi:uncharacterized RDD family membrane protein YckC
MGFSTTAVALGESGPTPVRAPASDRWIGQRIDHFEIQSLLGRGGMGAVYLAHDVSLDRLVALKMVPDELAGDPALEERFVREARAQARLSSPNVVQIYYVGHASPATQRRVLYFAMERIVGEALEATLERHDVLDPETARQTMIQAARGLRDAHAANVVHRDIKPSNMLVTPQGVLKIADFGLAKPVTGDGVSITEKGALLGTPLYMSPEQASEESVGFPSDMYALGCAFFHLMAGEPPYQGKTAVTVIAGHLAGPVPSLRARQPKVPMRTAAIVERLMAKDPKARYASYEDLIDALEAAAPTSVEYAGFWTRGAAVFINFAIAAGLVTLMGWPGVVIHLLHITIGHAYWGASIGKYLLRIRVQRITGEMLGLYRSAVRTVLSLWLPMALSGVVGATQGKRELVESIEHLTPKAFDQFRALVLAFGVSHSFQAGLYVAGLVLAAFHPQKQAFHDLVVRSVVVYRRNAN